MVTMLYVTTDILLKVVLNTNKTGHHVIRYNWHIVESGVKHQLTGHHVILIPDIVDSDFKHQ
jgi:hypothetical protein